MRIDGIDPKVLCNEVILILPRGEDRLVFKARGRRDMDEFDAICPLPKPPGKQTRDGWVPNMNDPTYQQVASEWSKKRLGYLVVSSLSPSNIEWDTVSLADPRTWPNWEKELLDNGLSQIECNRVLGLVMEANALDEEKLKKARDVFLLGQVPMPEEFSGPSTEPANTQSGTPASV